MSSFYDYSHMFPKGTEAGTGSYMRVCPTSGQAPPQVDPKQQTQQVQGALMNYPSQRPANIYSRPAAPRMNSRPPPTPPMMVPSGAYLPNPSQGAVFGKISHSTRPLAPSAMIIPSHPYQAVIIQQAPPPHSSIQGARHQSHGGGQAGTGAAPSYYAAAAPNQSQLYPSMGYSTYNSYVYSAPMRNNTFATQAAGPQQGAPTQHPPQPPQHYVMDHSVGSGGGPGPAGSNASVIMSQHSVVPQQTSQQPATRRRKNALSITDPNTGRDILSDILSENSEDANVTATPLSNPSRDVHVAAEFAEKVAKAVADDKYKEASQVVPTLLAPAISNGPSTPPPSQPPPPTPPSSAVEINLPPSVLPPMPPAQTQNIIPAQSQQISIPVASLLPQAASQTLNQSHSMPHTTLHSQQTPQIPTVSANSNSPTIDLPRSKGPASAHSPGRKPTPVPSTVQPIMDQKKKEKKVNNSTGVLPTHREEPEEGRKPSFTETINIKNVQPVHVPSVHHMSISQNVSSHVNEPETNGEQEIQMSTPAHAPKLNEKHEQPPQERGGKIIQKPKAKKKATMKELNRKGQEKEGGTDMDAFTSVTPSVPPAVIIPAETGATPSPSVPASTPASSVPSIDLPVQVKLSECQSPLVIPPIHQLASTHLDAIPPVTSVKNVDNEKDEGMEEDMDEEEDEQSMAVAAKNEENAKVSAAPNPDSEERIVNETPVIEEPAPPLLKHTYKEGQWSPINPEGKRVYDRDFLLDIRHDDLSNKRPIIEECDILKTDSTNNNISSSNNNRRPLHGSNSMNISRDGFAPTFLRSSSSQRGGMMNKRGSQQGRPGGGGGRSKGMYPSSSQYKSDLEEELHWAQKGGNWKPDRCKTPPKLTDDEIRTEKLYKIVRGILNKLTPQKFDTLMAQILDLPIDNLLRLQGVVELVFDKAVDEPSFSRAYAKLCQNLGKLQIKNNDGSEGGVEATTFRKILLNKCQHMFEKKSNDGKKSDDERLAELQQQMTGEECKDKRKELQLLLEEEERKIRVKYVGLARFIGELFKLSMLTANIMHNCIKTLLEKTEEEPLECLCKLLTTVGKELEQASAPAQKLDIDEYFQKMRKLSTKSAQSKVSSRVRFMLQDVIELRTNKWVPRRDENNPKTMEQIQKDAERETLMESLQANTPRNKHDRDDRRRGGPRNNTQDSDGWQLERTSKFSRTYAFEPSKLQNLRGPDNEGTGGLSLGSHTQFSQWNSGSNAKRSGGEPKRSEFTNKYAVLGLQDEKKIAPMMSRKATPSSSIEKDRAIQGVREALGDRDNRHNRAPSSNPSSRDNSRIRGKPVSSSHVPTVEHEQQATRREETVMDPEACKKKARVLFEEWIANRNPQEAVDSIKETFPDSMQFIKPVMEFILDEKPHKRIAFGELLETLLSKEVASAAGVSKELSNCIELGEDLMIDLPHVWSYFAEFLVPPMSKGVFTFADLKVSCEPFRTPHLSKTLAEIFKWLIKEKGPAFIRSQWESSNVKLTDFIPESDVNSFIKTNNLGFLTGDSEIEPSEILPMSKVEDKLYNFLIQDGDKATDLICDWVKANVGQKSQDVEFINVLTRAVIKACLNNIKLIPGSLLKHSMLIKKYVDANEKRELACLSGIHHLIVNDLESPQGILVEIFQTLADNGTISLEGFLKWQVSTKHEIRKGVALKTLSHFFVSLSEQVDSGEEST